MPGEGDAGAGGPAVRSHRDVSAWATRWELSGSRGWAAAAARAGREGAREGSGGEVSTAVFTHKLLYLLERPACKALIAH